MFSRNVSVVLTNILPNSSYHPINSHAPSIVEKIWFCNSFTQFQEYLHNMMLMLIYFYVYVPEKSINNNCNVSSRSRMWNECWMLKRGRISFIWKEAEGVTECPGKLATRTHTEYFSFLRKNPCEDGRVFYVGCFLSCKLPSDHFLHIC